MAEGISGTGLNREQYEALEEMAMLLQDAGYDLEEQDHVEMAGRDLDTAAIDIREGDLASAAGNIESAAAELQKLNTDLLGSQIRDAGEQLDTFLEGET